MTSYEKEEIRVLPEKYRPLGAWAYFGYTILFAFPLIGFICLIIFALSSGNVNRRSFARSYFCGLILVLILVGIVIAVAGGFEVITEIFNQIRKPQ